MAPKPSNVVRGRGCTRPVALGEGYLQQTVWPALKNMVPLNAVSRADKGELYFQVHGGLDASKNTYDNFFNACAAANRGQSWFSVTRHRVVAGGQIPGNTAFTQCSPITLQTSADRFTLQPQINSRDVYSCCADWGLTTASSNEGFRTWLPCIDNQFTFIDNLAQNPDFTVTGDNAGSGRFKLINLWTRRYQRTSSSSFASGNEDGDESHSAVLYGVIGAGAVVVVVVLVAVAVVLAVVRRRRGQARKEEDEKHAEEAETEKELGAVLVHDDGADDGEKAYGELL